MWSVGLTSSHSTYTLLLHLSDRPLQQTPRTSAQTLALRLAKANEEKRHIILPRQPSVRRQIHLGQNIAVSILQATNLQLFKVGLVVHVPAKDDGAEAKARLGDGEEFLLGHEFAADDAVDVDAAHLDADIVLEELGQVGGGEFVEVRGVVELRHAEGLRLVA